MNERQHTRKDWDALTPHARSFIRAEYKHLRTFGYDRGIVRGTMNRLASTVRWECDKVEWDTRTATMAVLQDRADRAEVVQS